MRRALLRVAALGVFMTLTAPGVAWAHTTVSPEEVATNTTGTFTVSVPNEKDIPIVKEMVQAPEGFEILSASSPGDWRGSVEDGSITWSGGEIAEGEEREFTFEASSPEKQGEYLWSAFDTYEDGSVSEWSGAPASDSPASVVRVDASGSETGHKGGHGEDHGSPHGELPQTGGIGPLLYGGVGFALLALGLALHVRLRRS